MVTALSSQHTQLLASVSLFKKLYDQDKDVFDVLAIFIKYIIRKNCLFSFSEYQIDEALKSEFSFNIPISVINTTIKNRVKAKRSNGLYSIDQREIAFNIELESKIRSANMKTQNVLNELEQYVSQRLNHTFSEKDREILYQNYCSYQLNSFDNSDFTSYISEFILKKQNEPNNIIESINETLEGLVIYNGIMNTKNLNEIGLWRTKLTIYCDMDILFSLGGYNGSIFKNIISSFLGLVNEINCNKKTKNYIQLRYFDETHREMDHYFEKAIQILEHKEIVNPSKSAMNEILNGCATKSDVLSKKTRFYTILKKNNIKVDNNKYYEDPLNIKYNLISKELIERFVETYGKEESYILLLFKYINYINILRKGDNSKSIECTNYIFLSSNSTLFKMDYELKESDKESYPKIIMLDNLITILWFNLKKGLGDLQNTPSLNIVNKAKIILSSKMNTNVTQEYLSLLKSMEEGDIDEDYAISYLAELKNYATLPEQITIDFLAENDDIAISQLDIDAKIKENSLLFSQNNTLKSKIYESNKEIQNLQEKNAELEEELQNRLKAEKKRQAHVQKIKRTLIKIALVVFILFLIVCIILCVVFEKSQFVITSLSVITIVSAIITIACFFDLTFEKIIIFFKNK